jgi:hypothetical protein
LYVFLTRIDCYFERNKLIKKKLTSIDFYFERNKLIKKICLTSIDFYFESNAGKGTRDFIPLEDYRFFHHWFSGVKTP